ncbi:hypothetical protein [Polycladidibacter stylochi]|uniref:hypothetical protein n=1 Tax=Polycladidibacter stylochi TaxID=1807766 RepID=UPI000832D131|nr:hypothetical protein [Pseudovibrio stylochi]
MQILSKLALVTCLLIPFTSLKASELAMPKLEQISGRAEVVSKSTLNIHSNTGITQIALMHPANTKMKLRQQLHTAVMVKCFLFGSADAASCVAIDALGSKWAIGK